MAKKGGVAVDVLDCEIALRRALDLVHLVRVRLDSDAVPGPQYPNQFCFFSLEGALEVAAPGK